jgi:hypothetical protein
VQTKKGKSERNDHLIAVPVQSHRYAERHELIDLSADLLTEIERFFICAQR